LNDWSSWAWGIAAALIVAELMTRGLMVRTVWREVVRFFVLFDLQAMRMVQKVKAPRYVLRGGCQKRGLCCTQIVGNPPRFVKQSFLLKLFAGYHRVMHNFHVVGRGPEDSLVFACGHLKSDGRCGIYRYRPLICRNYPVVPYYSAPSVLPGCGYRVVLRDLADAPRREGLRIVNPNVSVHHPTPPHDDAPTEAPEDFHWVDTQQEPV
jgi:hypothetical protein